MLPVAIVGSGISGLSAAYELSRRGIECALLEASSRPGGVILTERAEPFLIDAGPDSFLAQKPAAVELCRELGLSDQLIATEPPRTAYVLRGGTLYPLPEASLLGVPTGLLPVARSRLLSMTGRARMALDLVLPGRAPDADESLASFFGRRFGREALAYVAEPLLAGIHAGDVDRLSMASLFPRLVEAEREHGSVIRALHATRGGRPANGAFRSLKGGVQGLVDAIVRMLPAGALRCGARVIRIEGNGPFSVIPASGDTLAARVVIVAAPAFVAGDLLAALDPELASLCREVRYTSTATVVLAYDRGAVRHPLQGAGFVVPRAERAISILASTWISAKWAGRAPDGRVLLRAFVGGARNPEALERSDQALVNLAHGDLARILEITSEPLFARVYRWERANPQHEVGHQTRLAAIEARPLLETGLFLTGSGFRGLGIPDCVAEGRRAGARAAAFVEQERSSAAP